MAHETSTGSSPIIRGLMNGLREVLPKEDQEKLATYTVQAEASSPRGDLHRAAHCLHWAIEVSEQPKHSHLSGVGIRLKETYKAWQDIVLGTEFGSDVKMGTGNPSQEIKGDQKIGPGEDIELLWVGEAVSVAQERGGEVRLGRRSVGGARPRGSSDRLRAIRPRSHGLSGRSGYAGSAKPVLTSDGSVSVAAIRSGATATS